MGTRARHTHALLAPAFPGSAVPVAATVGGLFLVRSLAYSAFDPAPARPCAVIDVPTGPFGRVVIVTRTSDTSVRGVYSPADPGNGLDRDGVFSELHTVESILWHGGNVNAVGTLVGDVLASVLERFL